MKSLDQLLDEHGFRPGGYAVIVRTNAKAVAQAWAEQETTFLMGIIKGTRKALLADDGPLDVAGTEVLASLIRQQRDKAEAELSALRERVKLLAEFATLIRDRKLYLDGVTCRMCRVDTNFGRDGKEWHEINCPMRLLSPNINAVLDSAAAQAVEPQKGE